MIYVRAEGDRIVTYPYTFDMLRADNPDVSFSREPSEECLADFGVFQIAESEPPAEDGKYAVASGPVYVKGRWVQGWKLEDAPRRMVRKSIITARLIEAGKMAAAYAALTSNPDNFARWIAADRPAIYADDPDALALLNAIGADVKTVMAP